MSRRPLSKRTLRTMRERWQRDADRLNDAYPYVQENMRSGSDSEHETLRNLETAIACIDGLITRASEPAPSP